MNSPKERYEQDTTYHQLVDMIEQFLCKAHFTPSEVREAAVMACIHYEMRHGLRYYTVPLEVNEAFSVLTDWREKKKAKKEAKK